GKLRAQDFPKILGAHQDEPLDDEVVRQKFAALVAEMGGTMTPEEAADGFITIAVQNMANAIKKISVARGHAITKYALPSFGGAGGQHACRVAETLGIRTIIIHPFSGLLSAFGIGLGDLRASRQKSIEETLDDSSLASAEATAKALIAETRAELATQGVAADE